MTPDPTPKSRGHRVGALVDALLDRALALSALQLVAMACLKGKAGSLSFLLVSV